MAIDISKYVRVGSPGDVDILLKMCRNFHVSSPYKTMPFDYHKGREFLSAVCSGNKLDHIVLVGLLDEKPIGCIIAAASEPAFSSVKIATELGWWIEPKHRHTRTSVLLYSAYEDWAYRIGASYVQGAYLPGVSPDLDTFYKRRGYIQVESSYIKTLRL